MKLQETGHCSSLDAGHRLTCEFCGQGHVRPGPCSRCTVPLIGSPTGTAGAVPAAWDDSVARSVSNNFSFARRPRKAHPPRATTQRSECQPSTARLCGAVPLWSLDDCPPIGLLKRPADPPHDDDDYFFILTACLPPLPTAYLRRRSLSTSLLSSSLSFEFAVPQSSPFQGSTGHSVRKKKTTFDGHRNHT